MLRASPMSQVAKTRVLWLMGLEQCIAGLDADEGKICPVNPCEPLCPLGERFLLNRRGHRGSQRKTLDPDLNSLGSASTVRVVPVAEPPTLPAHDDAHPLPEPRR